ncbi:amino acid adenylation domain-containing protein [Mycobacterium sp.]|uniref:amino acid adenylation domain-containing protein n=1 Tax=Mycobacterium sp. TaxID=1785 RepID=UPI0031DFB7BC
MRELIAHAVGATPTEVSVDTPVNRLGVNSVRAVEITDALAARRGIDVPLREFLGGLSMRELAHRLAGGSGPGDDVDTDARDGDPDDGGTFELTDLQQAYVAGRNELFELGGVGAHVYAEVDSAGLDLGRLEAAWRVLIDQHDALRTTVSARGFQYIDASSPTWSLPITDLRGHPQDLAESILRAAREDLSHQVFPLDRWPMFELRVHRLDGDRQRIHLSADLLTFDAASLLELVDQWRRLYQDPTAEIHADHGYRQRIEKVSATKQSHRYHRALFYWRERAPLLPNAPRLPRSVTRELAAPRYTRFSGGLRERDWTSFCARATQFGLTPSVALLAAYCEVLATWSEEPRFTVNVTMQHEANAATHRAIGPSADFMLTGVDWSARSSFLARAEDLRQQVLTDLDHRELGGVGILREFARANGYVATAAKAPVVFTPVLRDLGVFDWLGAPAAGASQTPQVALDNQSFLRGGALAFQWDVVEQLFAPGVIVDMFAAYQRLLEKLATDEAAWTNTAALQLVPVEQLRMRAQINDTATPILAMRLEELFTQQCRRDPDRVALVHGGTAWTYAELNAKAAALASWLQSENVQPDELIAIVAEKGCEQTVAVLATLMAGAAYVPLPADLPAARLSSLIADARVRIVLTQARLFDRTTWPDQIRVVAIDALDLARMPQTVSPPKRRLDDRCVVLYTSGSTGPPKGVQLQHHGLVNAITHTIKTFGIGADDRSLAVTDLHHDMSVFDIFGVLAVGGALVTVPHQLRRDPAAWLELVADQRVSIWNSVPASVQMLLDRAEATDTVVPPSLRLILLGGDWIPVDLPGRIRARGSEAEIVSVGGPTETSLWNIAHRVDVTHLDGTSIPYGRPIANTRYYVLDDALNERPDWVTGELCSSGIGTSPGYLNDPELSAEKFVRHPRTGETICRTGDYGRWNPDGYIEFIGRRDGQVQIDGRRVELREIETVLAQHRDIQSCVVTAHPHAHGRRRLVAHVVATEGGGDSNVLAAYLSQQLPEHMRPGVFRFLDAIPTTRNGKQDRQALEADAERADRPSAPPTAAPREGSIAAIVAEVLGVDEIPAHATLSELGVGSLQMVRIAAAIEDTLGLRPDIEQLFTAASIEELGATLTERAGPSSDHGETGGRSGVHSASQPLAAYDIIADPEARQRFREQRRGLRQDYPADPQAVSFPLTRQADADGERSSCREFIGDAVNQSELGQLLSALRDLDTTGHHRRHRYGSGGGTYSVQIYLHIKPGRVEDLTAGCYYYDPSRHSLISLSSESDRFTDELHWWWNRALFRDCAFSLFLVAQLDAIGPLYGQQSMHFATLEAGLITQLLETTAISTGIGLCQIGQLEFAEVRQHFLLSDSHVLLHSLVGGVRAPHVGEPASVESDPTRAAEGLDDALARPGSCVNVETLAAKATLDQAIRRDPAATAIAPQPQWQLLTGATGFLGGFILRELLARGQEVVCLVRAPDEKTARMRLQRNADRLGIDWSTGRDAITALPGDIALPRLGLSERQFDELAGAVTGIYHCAAPVNWVKAYTSLQDGIVGALREILGLAVRRRTKVLHYVSSMAVFPFDGLSSSEDHTLDHKRPLLGGYAQAKWVAERITVEAARRGLPIATYRPPLIAGHSRTGVFNADSYFERMIKGCVELGQAPSLDGVIDVSPVDYVANALVTLSEQSDSVGQTFHLNNPHPIAFVDFVEWMVRRGYAVRPVPFTQWQHDLTAGPHSRSSALTPLEPHLRHASWATMTTAAHDCTRTVGALSAVSDLRCPPVGDDLLNVYFSAFETSGYLTPRSQVWRSRR